MARGKAVECLMEGFADPVARRHEVTLLTGKPNYPAGMVFEDFAGAPAVVFL